MDDFLTKLVDNALARWCQHGREVVSVSEVTDVLLDIRAAAVELDLSERVEAE